jgi:hypothetical protein
VGGCARACAGVSTAPQGGHTRQPTRRATAARLRGRTRRRAAPRARTVEEEDGRVCAQLHRDGEQLALAGAEAFSRACLAHEAPRQRRQLERDEQSAKRAARGARLLGSALRGVGAQQRRQRAERAAGGERQRGGVLLRRDALVVAASADSLDVRRRGQRRRGGHALG